MAGLLPGLTAVDDSLIAIEAGYDPIELVSIVACKLAPIFLH